MYARKTLGKTMGIILSAPLSLALAADPGAGSLVVDTGQAACFDDTQQISCPEEYEAWFGQDAQYQGNQSDYQLAADTLTVYDQITGLTWQQSADVDGDGDIDADDKFTWSELRAYADWVNVQGHGGYSDWRLPSIKELYSLINFQGIDPHIEDTDTTGLIPFIDTDYFAFAYGDTDAGERVIDSQWATSTLYVADNNMMFGVNFADGRIKGYGMSGHFPGQGEKTFYVRLVRGDTGYGSNDFRDNDDNTVTDNATGLTWMRQDSFTGMVWQDALAYCADVVVGGLGDWRLPNAKELQGIVDYTRSPDTTASAAIDPVFDSTPILNEAGADDFPYYWSSTTHIRWGGLGDNAVYVAFGRGLGEMNNVIIDVHGAGSQRSDPKYGTADQYPQSFGPQGDIRAVFNHVRCVRGGVDDEIFTGGDGPPDTGGGGGEPGSGEPGKGGPGNGGPGSGGPGSGGPGSSGPSSGRPGRFLRR